MRNLTLARPLVSFDLETTGRDVRSDRIVQLAFIRVEPDGTRETLVSLVDPERPIPPGATAVHGIRDEDVRGAPTLAALLPRVTAILAGADLTGFNVVRFDLPFLEAEVRRAGGALDLREVRLVDAMSIFHLKEPRDLSAAVRFYCGRELADAHDALADAAAALDVLDAQLARYGDLPRDMAGLHRLCDPRPADAVDGAGKLRWDDAGEAVLGFGSHRGTPLRVMAGQRRDYLEWMLNDPGFAAEVKEIVRLALAGTFPRRGAPAPTPAAAAPARAPARPDDGPWTLFPVGGE